MVVIFYYVNYVNDRKKYIKRRHKDIDLAERKI